MSKKKNYKAYNNTKNDYSNIGDDLKKLGGDIKNIYKKVDYKIPAKIRRSPDLIKYLIISAIIVLLIFTRVGIPIAILILIFALYSSNKR